MLFNYRPDLLIERNVAVESLYHHEETVELICFVTVINEILDLLYHFIEVANDVSKQSVTDEQQDHTAYSLEVVPWMIVSKPYC